MQAWEDTGLLGPFQCFNFMFNQLLQLNLCSLNCKDCMILLLYNIWEEWLLNKIFFKKKGRSAKRARAATASADNEYSTCPHSFIFNKDTVGKNVMQLIKDMRRVMEPFTASNLKVRRVMLQNFFQPFDFTIKNDLKSNY